MILSGHQPCYLPSLYLFALMAKSNLFMHCGHLQYVTKSWHSHNHIKNATLTVPIQRPHKIPLRDAWFADQHWKEKHLRSMYFAYGKSPYFDQYYPQLQSIINYHPHSLERLNIDLTNQIAKWLGITTQIIDSAGLHIEGSKIDKLIQMCRGTGADIYLSKRGADENQGGYIGLEEEQKLWEAGIEHRFLNFKDPDEKPLSAVHHLFTLGPDAQEVMISGLG